MDAILQQIADWLKGMLVDGIMNNLSGMFDAVNQQVGDVASQVGMTPAGFSPGVFATDVALRKVAAGTPWRDAYHDVRDHLEQLDAESPDAAVALKKHEGTCLGLDHDLYRSRIAAAVESAEKRRRELDAHCRRLLK